MRLFHIYLSTEEGIKGINDVPKYIGWKIGFMNFFNVWGYSKLIWVYIYICICIYVYICMYIIAGFILYIYIHVFIHTYIINVQTFLGYQSNDK